MTCFAETFGINSKPKHSIGIAIKGIVSTLLRIIVSLELCKASLLGLLAKIKV